MAEGNRTLLQALAIEVSTVMENARLIEHARESRRMAEELRVARRIQRSLRPSALPQTGWLTACGHCEARGQVSGDYYDLMQVGHSSWSAVVADVSGKGLAAALLASLLQGAFFLGSGPEVSLSGTLGRINRYLCSRSRETRFATVFALVLDRDGTMRWSNAGHCPAVVVRTDGTRRLLEPTSRPVGLFEDVVFVEQSALLEAGDKVVVYSDGVTEMRNAAGEQFGEERLEAAIRGLANRGADDLLDGLLARVAAFAGTREKTDDMTLLVLGFRGDGDPTAAGSRPASGIA